MNGIKPSEFERPSHRMLKPPNAKTLETEEEQSEVEAEENRSTESEERPFVAFERPHFAVRSRIERRD